MRVLSLRLGVCLRFRKPAAAGVIHHVPFREISICQ